MDTPRDITGASTRQLQYFIVDELRAHGINPHDDFEASYSSVILNFGFNHGITGSLVIFISDWMPQLYDFIKSYNDISEALDTCNIQKAKEICPRLNYIRYMGGGGENQAPLISN